MVSRSVVALLAVASALPLTGCVSERRIIQLEERQNDLELKTEGLLSDLSSVRRQQAEFLKKVNDLRSEVEGLKAIVTGTSRLKISIEPGTTWKTLYGNSTGLSQIVRLTHTEGRGTAQLVLRVQPVKSEPSVPGDPNSTPVGATPEWDLTAIGAQRWVRLACGLEIKGRSASDPQVVDVLIAVDPHPISCDE